MNKLEQSWTYYLGKKLDPEFYFATWKSIYSSYYSIMKTKIRSILFGVIGILLLACGEQKKTNEIVREDYKCQSVWLRVPRSPPCSHLAV